MSRRIQLLYQRPLLDRYAREAMWFGGGFLVLPPGHWWFAEPDERATSPQHRVHPPPVPAHCGTSALTEPHWIGRGCTKDVIVTAPELIG